MARRTLIMKRALLSLLLSVGLSPHIGSASPLGDAPESWKSALRQRGATYKPRTEHLSADGQPKYLNRLILETSPYLRQHAHNPVDWYPWGEEAFAVALREDKPILLSIGYSTCHWCHVMERESFEDEEIAAYINAHYVAIKVDREERPDLDDVYMKAVQALSGRGGWPMTTLLTPHKQPFFGGTYFPARDGDRGRQTGFLSILKTYQQKYQSQRGELLASARQLSRYISRNAFARPAADAPNPSVVVDVMRRLTERFDPRWGGFGRAPKFPTPPRLNLLLRYYQRVKDPHALKMLTETLTWMARGGIYDHVGGGFHRYSTDTRWLVPHFEKMLYDNAQLASLYLKASRYVSGSQHALFLRVARQTLDYLNREMRSPDALYYSATDADSLGPDQAHPEEGLFFMWTPQELSAALSEEDAALVTRVYRVTARGDLDGRNILHRRASLSTLARREGVTEAELLTTLNKIHASLYRVRSKRTPPLRDDKAITSWNSLALSAMVHGARHLDPRYLRFAQETADALLTRLRKRAETARSKAPSLNRTYMEGRARHAGVLDDYAFLIQGLLDLFEETGEARWLSEAVSLQAELDAHFADKTRGGYFMTSDLAEALIVRDRPSYDGAEPSGNSVSALNLSRLYALTGQDRYRARLALTLRGFSRELSRGSVETMLGALMGYHGRQRELALIIPEGADRQDPMLRALSQGDWPNTVVVRATQSSRDPLEALIPWLREKVVLERGGAQVVTAYLCYEGTCEAPTADPKSLINSLSQTAPLLPNQSPAPLKLR